MSKRDCDIFHMQCWIFRFAQTEWNKTAQEVTEIFQNLDILGFISDCYDILHQSSYQCAFDDVEQIVRNAGIQV